jgi:hypothetical protein
MGLRSPLGSFKEKLAVLTFLGDKPNGEISLRDALLASGTGDLFENLLKPFLRGVFLDELENVDSSYGREIIKSFVLGDSGLPRAGVGALTEALGARVESVQLNSPIESLSQFEGRKIILATDSATAAKLLKMDISTSSVSSTTWYHSIPAGMLATKRLRVTSASSPLVNSIAISNLVPEYAPEGRTLISSTSLATLSDSNVASELSKFWGLPSADFELIKRYEIESSLPQFLPGEMGASSARVSDSVFIAGDYRAAGSQNGALLSGRLAALESLTN